MKQRVCTRDCYIHHNSIFSTILLSPYMVSIFYSILSSILTISIIYGITTYPLSLWIYLSFHILIVIIIYKFLLHILRDSIKDKYIEIISREWTIRVSSIILLSVYIYIFINGYRPDYLSDSLMQTIKQASNSIYSDCRYIDYILRIHIELDSSFWWITTHSSEVVKDTIIQNIIWLSFISINALAILGINRFIVQVVYFLDRLFSITPPKRRGERD